MSTISSTASLTLDLPPSCIAFCPSRPQLFVVGTYFLHPRELRRQDTASSRDRLDDDDGDDDALTVAGRDSPTDQEQKRTGSLILFHLDRDDKLILLQTEPTDFAILDIQWSPHSEQHGNLLAVATSTGVLAFYRLHASDSSESPQRLALACVKQICDPTTLVLSLAWHPLQAHVLGVTLSDGRVCLCETIAEDDGTGWNRNAADVRMLEIHQHELEAWTLAFSSPEEESTSALLSGGDDIVLQRSQIHDPQNPLRVWQDRKTHDAGVTAILPLSDTLVVTGSYDDNIRLLLTPASGRRQTLASLNLGGGVWRLKLLEGSSVSQGTIAGESALSANTSFVLLASCMHAGTRIVKLSRQGRDDDGGGRWTFEILAKFEEHQSMNYGTDVQPCRSNNNIAAKTIVSTSFYDKLLCLWKFD